MKRASSIIAMAWTLLLGCGEEAPARPGSDGGAGDAALERDASYDAAEDGRAGDDGSRPDAAGTPDAGTVDTGAPCDPASYYSSCDADPSRILNCLTGASGATTVHAVPCGAGRTCFAGPSGGASCGDADLGLCDDDFVARCDGERTLIVCTLFASPDGFVAGVETRDPCDASDVCVTLPDDAGAACGPAGSETCDVATYVPTCHDDHLYRDCVSGLVRVRNPCGASYACVRTTGSTFTCVDATLTACDPDTFVDSCERAPDTSVVCDPTGYVTHATCGTTNPTCVVIDGHAGCSYPGAPSMCPAAGGTACESDASEHVLACTADGIPVRSRCIVSPLAPTCACRRGPTGAPPSCYTEAGVPCASTSV